MRIGFSSAVLLGLLASGPSHAMDRMNRQLVATVSLVHTLKQDHPWGVRAGATRQFVLADHCSYGETECHRGPLWPVAGPAASLTWRGALRFSAELDLEAGVSNAEMYHFGYLPKWSLVARTGLRYDAGANEVSWVVGGAASRSAGFDERIGGSGTRTHGSHALGLRLDADTARVFGDTWRPPTLGIGPWAALGAVGTLDLH